METTWANRVSPRGCTDTFGPVSHDIYVRMTVAPGRHGDALIDDVRAALRGAIARAALPRVMFPGLVWPDARLAEVLAIPTLYVSATGFWAAGLEIEGAAVEVFRLDETITTGAGLECEFVDHGGDEAALLLNSTAATHTPARLEDVARRVVATLTTTAPAA